MLSYPPLPLGNLSRFFFSTSGFQSPPHRPFSFALSSIWLPQSSFTCHCMHLCLFSYCFPIFLYFLVSFSALSFFSAFFFLYFSRVFVPHSGQVVSQISLLQIFSGLFFCCCHGFSSLSYTLQALAHAMSHHQFTIKWALNFPWAPVAVSGVQPC